VFLVKELVFVNMRDNEINVKNVEVVKFVNMRDNEVNVKNVR
jgi:hypothetical protein